MSRLTNSFRTLPWPRREAVAGTYVVLVLISVVALNPRVGRPGAMVAVELGVPVAVAVALVLVLLGRVRQAIWLSSMALFLLLGNLTVLTSGTEAERWLSLSVPPLVLALAAGSLAEGMSVGVILALSGGLLAGPVRTLYYDPLRDADCDACLPNAIVLKPDVEIAAVLGFIGGLLVLIGTLVIMARGRRSLLKALLVVAAGASLLSYDTPLGLGRVAVSFGAWIAICGGLLACVEVADRRRRLSRLTSGLGSEEGPDLVMQRVLSDPSLRVVFPVPSGGRHRWVDPHGGLLSDLPTDRRRTSVMAAGEVCAVLLHDKDVTNPPLWPLAPELTLGLAGARLNALLEMQATELQRSRARLVERADAEARALERDLHDGAQQHLLAFGLAIQAELLAATETDRGVLKACMASTESCLEALREISHGIYPPLLSVSGLMPALTALARGSDTSIRHLAIPTERLPEMVERTAYLVVLDMALRAEGPVSVVGEVEGQSFNVQVIGPPLSENSLLYDRVAATGGSLEASPTGVVVRIPCG